MNHSQLREAIREANARKPDYTKGMTIEWWARAWDCHYNTAKRDIDNGLKLGLWTAQDDWRKWGEKIFRTKTVYRPKDGYPVPKEADE